jgi:hypothetical protein
VEAAWAIVMQQKTGAILGLLLTTTLVGNINQAGAIITKALLKAPQRAQEDGIGEQPLRLFEVLLLYMKM